MKTALEPFLFQTYDGERGEGVAPAIRFRIKGYPTLIVLDGDGNELVHQLGMSPKEIGKWLKDTAALVRMSETEVKAKLESEPGNLALLHLMANRARSRGDMADLKSWLAKIEARDKSEGRDDAAMAAWEQVGIEMRDVVADKAKTLARSYLERYPAVPGDALALLAASGADRAAVEAAYVKPIEAAKGGRLNLLVYSALGAGAYDAALKAAQRQLELIPDDANSYDTLAEVYNYRGDKETAVQMSKKGLAMKDIPPDLAAGMRQNLARFERGGRDSAIKPSSLDRLLMPRTSLREVTDPVEAAKRQFSHETERLGACSERPEGMSEVWVRIRLGTGNRPEKVEVLEPGAPAALRRCVEEALMGVEVPADNQPSTVVMALGLPKPKPVETEAAAVKTAPGGGGEAKAPGTRAK